MHSATDDVVSSSVIIYTDNYNPVQCGAAAVPDPFASIRLNVWVLPNNYGDTTIGFNHMVSSLALTTD